MIVQFSSEEITLLWRLERAITRIGLPLGFDGDPLAESFSEADTHGDLVAACELLAALPTTLRNVDRRLAYRMCQAAVFGRNRTGATHSQPKLPVPSLADAKLERERYRQSRRASA